MAASLSGKTLLCEKINRFVDNLLLSVHRLQPAARL